jgi:hypothetical protein
MEASIMEAGSHKLDSVLIRRLQNLYTDFSIESVNRIDEVYTQDVEFVDPVHRIQGCLGLKNYLRKMAANLDHYQIQYTDTLIGANNAFLGWTLEFSHPRINHGKIITLQGMSQVKFTSKIYYHEDAYDLGAMLYENLPVLGTVVRGIKRKLADQG